mmetsp:Transcript_96373/g.257789  ORF Transcript_96373/g.257789 Transcript_96373/m.257789 type:complete len:86 (+) Transcript_96373:227-484(+)
MMLLSAMLSQCPKCGRPAREACDTTEARVPFSGGASWPGLCCEECPAGDSFFAVLGDRQCGRIGLVAEGGIGVHLLRGCRADLVA